MIPGLTHDSKEEARHMSLYKFFKEEILADANSSPISIIDIGCGVGWGDPLLADIPNSSVLGIDISKECISYACKHYPKANISYQTMSVEELIQSDLKPDYLVSGAVFEHVDNLFSVLKQLKYNKKLIFGVPYKEKPGNSLHHKWFNLKEEDFKDFPTAKFYYSSMDSGITRTPELQSIDFLVVVEVAKPLIFRDFVDKFVYDNVAPGDSVLDLGCGDKQRTKLLTRDNKVLSVDAWAKAQPDLLLDLENVLLPFADNSFDVVLMIDFIEHLSKEAGHRIMEEAKRVCKRRVILFTPAFWTENKENVENPGLWNYQNQYDLHKSFWSVDDFPNWESIKYPDSRFLLRTWDKNEILDNITVLQTA
jgi:2-polyprenyl-3-methyl-5-hydroxy-6-metoxy-1,4-benzoquinol methylase